jgi:hypothetical protein
MDENKVNAFVDALREALRAEHGAGYAFSRYVYDLQNHAGELKDRSDAAEANKNEATVAMWAAFYDMMDKDNQ